VCVCGEDSERHGVTGGSSRSRGEAAARSANATIDDETDARTGNGSSGRVQSTQPDMEDEVKACWIGLGAVVVLGRSTGRRNWRAGVVARCGVRRMQAGA
jgi:hypothetical protein